MRATDIASKETYTIGEAVAAIETMAGNEIADIDTMDGSISVKWTGSNRVEVFDNLAQHGWIVTSVDSSFTWFDRVATVVE
jgi:hypothetical protein